MRLTSACSPFNFFVRGNRCGILANTTGESLRQKRRFPAPEVFLSSIFRRQQTQPSCVCVERRKILWRFSFGWKPLNCRNVLKWYWIRLCGFAQLPAAPELHELASNRVLQHAANSLAFNSVLRRVKLAAAIQNGCTFNLRLALVAAAWDGANVDLDTGGSFQRAAYALADRWPVRALQQRRF